MCCEDPVTTMFITLSALIGGHIWRKALLSAPTTTTNEPSLLHSQCVGRLLSVLPSNVCWPACARSVTEHRLSTRFFQEENLSC